MITKLSNPTIAIVSVRFHRLGFPGAARIAMARNGGVNRTNNCART
jgi:hypothetical protein